MKDVATALGYALTVALAAAAFYAGYTTLLDLRADPLAQGAAALCGAVSAAVAWPRPPVAAKLAKPRIVLRIGSRTALWFYLLFTTATVAQRFPDYFGAPDGSAQSLAAMLFSLPALVIMSLGMMIYATFGAAFFVSAFIAAGWVRLARRIHHIESLDPEEAPAPRRARARARPAHARPVPPAAPPAAPRPPVA